MKAGAYKAAAARRRASSSSSRGEDGGELPARSLPSSCNNQPTQSAITNQDNTSYHNIQPRQHKYTMTSSAGIHALPLPLSTPSRQDSVLRKCETPAGEVGVVACNIAQLRKVEPVSEDVAQLSLHRWASV